MRICHCRKKAFLFVVTGVLILLFITNRADNSEPTEAAEILWTPSANPEKWIFPEDVPNTFADNRIEQQNAYIPENIRPGNIIIYQPSDFNRRVTLGYREFQANACKVQNCFLTTFERHKYKADVVLFHDTSDIYFNRPRDATQLWVMSLLESPENTETLTAYDNMINYTASYRWDSDIVTPYGYWKPFVRPIMPTTYMDFAKGKTRQVVWMVSHCLTANGRMPYAKELAKYIEVDIFGECSSKQLETGEAFARLRNDYRFYLAFENSNCLDYVTEKFFMNALENNVVPIVMGASREFYELIAPPGSFIHVDDFATPRELAEYLVEISKNATKYNEFFNWKSVGHLADTKFYCRLCAMVQSGRRKVYKNIDGWWRRVDDCPSTN